MTETRKSNHKSSLVRHAAWQMIKLHRGDRRSSKIFQNKVYRLSFLFVGYSFYQNGCFVDCITFITLVECRRPRRVHVKFIFVIPVALMDGKEIFFKNVFNCKRNWIERSSFQSYSTYSPKARLRNRMLLPYIGRMISSAATRIWSVRNLDSTLSRRRMLAARHFSSIIAKRCPKFVSLMLPPRTISNKEITRKLRKEGWRIIQCIFPFPTHRCNCESQPRTEYNSTGGGAGCCWETAPGRTPPDWASSARRDAPSTGPVPRPSPSEAQNRLEDYWDCKKWKCAENSVERGWINLLGCSCRIFREQGISVGRSAQCQFCRE